MNQKHRSGFVTLVGRPNVGKSTLLNNIIGQKVSIISDKIQTTRTLVQGILSDEDSQIIFIDTPGIHKPKHRLGDYMVDVSLQTLADVDIVLFMVNATEGYGKGDQFILDKLNKIDKPIFLIINKVDQIHPDALFPIIEQYKDTCKFEEIIPISALNGNNVDKLLELLKEHLIVGPKYFDENQVTDKTDRFIISELIREKVLTYTEEEVPHSINVLIEDVTRNDQDKLQIQASIIVERESQKGILIGKKGSMLKRIGQSARRDIEQFLDEKIFLDLWIKVKKDWRNKPSLLTQYGFYLDE
ncbi:MAG TPA: GTPase Era [Pseudogracilibacillus sp.]|nr:GTPase Era [Pseudogracilibacillus sp.]